MSCSKNETINPIEVFYHDWDPDTLFYLGENDSFAIDLNNDNIVPELSNILVYPAYTNPFNPEVTFKYFLPTRFGEIQSEIYIYDLKGKLIDKIGSGKSKPGLNNVVWKANAPSGTYFMQMRTNNNNYSQKVQLVK